MLLLCPTSLPAPDTVWTWARLDPERRTVQAHGSAGCGQDGSVQCGGRSLLGATAEQPGQLAFFRRQRFVSVHAFNPARSLSIA